VEVLVTLRLPSRIQHRVAAVAHVRRNRENTSLTAVASWANVSVTASKSVPIQNDVLFSSPTTSEVPSICLGATFSSFPAGPTTR
jgi:hypothetical protein